MMRAVGALMVVLALSACNEPPDESTVYPNFEFVEISDPSQRTPDPTQPRLAVRYHAASDRIFVAGYSQQNNWRLELNICDGRGDGCTFKLASSQPRSGMFPSTILDEGAGALVVATTDGSNFDNPLLVRCALDGSACDEIALTPAGLVDPVATGVFPSLALDARRDRLVIATNDFSTGDSRLGVWTADRDGRNAVFHPIPVVAPQVAPLQPSLAIDPVRDELVIAIYDEAQEALALVTCGPSVNDCTFQRMNGLGYTPRALIDDRGRLFVTSYRPVDAVPAFLWRCTHGNGDRVWSCGAQELTKDLSERSGYTPAPVFDAANDEVVIALARESIKLRPFVRYCDADAETCGFGPSSLDPTPIDSAYFPAPIFTGSGQDRQLIVVASVFDPPTALYRPCLHRVLYPEVIQRN